MKNQIRKISNLIRNTPIVRLDIKNQMVIAKLESYNLTGSIKDRMAMYMVQQAIKGGVLKKGSVIIEATTGNTGIALAALSAVLDYKFIAVMPEDMSIERMKMLKLYGARVVLTKKNDGPQGAIRRRDLLARKIKNSWVPDQFVNADNVTAHIQGIARELLRQIDGRVDYLVHGIGTGGTLLGIAKVLKRKFPSIKVVAVEPRESAVIAGGRAGHHGIQGIGEGFIPSLVDMRYIDQVVSVSTSEAVNETRKIAKKYGLLVGISSGANIAAIKKVSGAVEGRKKFLTIFADRGERYLSVL
jgi:cysteine synthase